MQKVKTAGLMAVLAMLVVGMAPLALAQESASGEGTANNIAPTVPNAEPSPDNQISPESTEMFNCTVKDNNTLADIENVQLILYTTAAGVDGENAVENHYVFWFDPSDNSWHSVLGAAYIVTGSCTYPDDLTKDNDNYNFAVKLSGGAEAGTDWNAKWIAIDDNAASGSKTDTFEVLEYISLSIDINTQTFSGDPGATGLTASEGLITCTVSSGTNFDIETKLGADWSGAAYGGTIGADNTHALGEVSVDLTIDYQNVWTDETLGQGVEKTVTYTLDLPMPLRDDVYTATIYINAKKYTA